MSTPQTAYCLHYPPHFVFDTKSNFSFVHGELVEPYTRTLRLAQGERGYGTVYNAGIAYNVNKTLRNLAMIMSQDITAVAKNFDGFIAEWPGFNALMSTVNNQDFKNKKMLA